MQQKTNKCEQAIFSLALYTFILFLLHSIIHLLYNNTIVVQYQLVQSCLKLRVHNNNNNKRRKLKCRRAHYSKTNHGPLTRLTLFFCSFVIH